MPSPTRKVKVQDLIEQQKIQAQVKRLSREIGDDTETNKSSHFNILEPKLNSNHTKQQQNVVKLSQRI